MKDKFTFENLSVYNKSLDFCIRACKIAGNFPPKFFNIKDQLIRAALSIPLNIAEGCGRKTIKDKNNFYRTARASVFELIPILEICLSMDLMDKNIYYEYRENCVELSKMLSGLIKS